MAKKFVIFTLILSFGWIIYKISQSLKVGDDELIRMHLSEEDLPVHIRSNLYRQMDIARRTGGTLAIPAPSFVVKKEPLTTREYIGAIVPANSLLSYLLSLRRFPR